MGVFQMNKKKQKIFIFSVLFLGLFSTSILNSKKGLLHKAPVLLAPAKIAFHAIAANGGIKNALPLVGNNFYTVEAGQLYRSKQLNKKDLNSVIQKYGIKTILNLRGPNQGKKWYDIETIVAKQNNIYHFDIPFSAVRLPSKENIQALIFFYQYAPKPIYIHCAGGADRTGLASAVWLLLKGKTKKEAKKQLSGKFHHIMPETKPMDIFIDIWQSRNWALNEYDPENYAQYN